jgi:hypothetical protein
MPWIPLFWIGGGLALLWQGREFVDEAGEAAEQTGNASLKFAGAAAVLIGAWYLWGRA